MVDIKMAQGFFCGNKEWKVILRWIFVVPEVVLNLAFLSIF